MLKDGDEASGSKPVIVGVKISPKFNGLPMPVFGAGVNCVTFKSS